MAALHGTMEVRSLGSGQTVRHLTLDQAIRGSNPLSPAAQKARNHPLPADVPLRVRLRFLLAILGSLLVACGSAASGGVSDLRGRTFLSTGVTENGQPRQLVAGTRIRLSFSPDGRSVGAAGGCNQMGGPGRIENGRLVVGDLTMTMMGCDAGRAAQDSWLAAFLTGRPSVQLSSDVLVLTRDTTEIRFLDRTVAEPDRPLAGTHWIVQSLVDREAVSSVPAGAVAYLTLGTDGRFSGNTGCNEMGGGAAVTSTTITFSGAFTTRMACEPDRTRLEQAVLAVLREAISYEIDGDQLRLRHPGGRGLHLRAER